MLANERLQVEAETALSFDTTVRYCVTWYQGRFLENGFYNHTVFLVKPGSWLRARKTTGNYEGWTTKHWEVPGYKRKLTDGS